MNLLYHSLAIYLSLASSVSAASTSDGDKESDKACTITSPFTGSFFDLTSLQLQDPTQSKSKHPRDYSWNATGYDVGYNFTLNFCGPVLEPIEDVVGIEKDLWQNVSAYYKRDGKIYSLGQENSALVMRGRKLVLNYTDGSPCDTLDKRSHTVEDILRREIIGGGDDEEKSKDDDEDDDDDQKDSKKKSDVRRKNTIVSMLCDKDPLAPTLQLSFVGTMDECTYFFEGRSAHACATANTSKQTLNPAGVFGVIAMIAVLVYFVGGCVYNRAVLQQRGWQQVPNYTLWRGIWTFFRDLFIILTSSCARFAPSRRGYSRVNGGVGARGRGRYDSSDAENRLIDELNEEWDD